MEIEEETVQTIIDFVPTVIKDEADTIFLPGMAWRGLRRVGWTEPIQGFGSLLWKLV